MEKLHFEGNRFVNASGRQVLFHGLNVLNRQRPHLYPDLDKALPWFKASGFNLIRFGIFWDAAEPEPGTIDFAYLNEIKRLVRATEAHGIYVILDMHQDLFAQKFIDGAPDWACLDEGAYHPDNCNLWYEAYLSSEAIIKAADRGVTRFYSGGAEGFDLLCGALVLEVQRTRPQLQLMLVLPYTGHGERFSKADQRELTRQKEAAEEVVYLSTHYFPGCMALRNRQLVADADLCIAYLTHAPSGTAQTVGFAREKGIEVLYV